MIDQPGKYVLQVKDDNGCYGTDTINVYSKNCETGVYFPTAFTPNGDLVNDVFRSQFRGTLITYKLQIFNRWGGLVFTTTDPHKGWDGTAKGENIGSNVFVWSCRYQLQGSSEVEDHGVITLIR